MYKNHSGYANPTEGAVVAKMMREYREKQKGISRKQQEIRERPRVYVVSKYAGDVVRRIGQTKRGVYIHLVCKGTIDEKVMGALKQKADVSKLLVDDYKKILGG